MTQLHACDNARTPWEYSSGFRKPRRGSEVPVHRRDRHAPAARGGRGRRPQLGRDPVDPRRRELAGEEGPAAVPARQPRSAAHAPAGVEPAGRRPAPAQDASPPTRAGRSPASSRPTSRSAAAAPAGSTWPRSTADHRARQPGGRRGPGRGGGPGRGSGPQGGSRRHRAGDLGQRADDAGVVRLHAAGAGARDPSSST